MLKKMMNEATFDNRHNTEVDKNGQFACRNLNAARTKEGR